MSEPFEIRETRLCAELGVSKDELRRRRQYFLVEGVHWAYVAKRVLFAQKGAQILRGTRKALLPPAGEKGASTADSERPRPALALLPEKTAPAAVFAGRLIAWAMPRHNVRLVVAYLPGTDPQNPLHLVSCLVRDNRHFLRGMEIPGPGRRVALIGEGRFELVGAVPRWRGRW